MARLIIMVIGLLLINVTFCVNGMPVEDTDTAKKGVVDPDNYKEEKSTTPAMIISTASHLRLRRQIFLLSTPNPITINPQLLVNNVDKNIKGMLKRDVTTSVPSVEISQKGSSGSTTTSTVPGKVRRAALPWTPSPTQDVYDNYLGKVRREVLSASSPTTQIPLQKI